MGLRPRRSLAPGASKTFTRLWCGRRALWRAITSFLVRDIISLSPRQIVSRITHAEASVFVHRTFLEAGRTTSCTTRLCLKRCRRVPVAGMSEKEDRHRLWHADCNEPLRRYEKVQEGYLHRECRYLKVRGRTDRKGNRLLIFPISSDTEFLAFVLFLVACLTLHASYANAAVRALWYVSATASPGGDGSRERPFDSLAAVEAASAPGIVK